MHETIEEKLDFLEAKSVEIIDRRQTYLDDAVDLDRIYSGAVLHPGTRLVGPLTFVGPNARVGTEGPAVLENAVIGENTVIASGYLNRAVMLRDASVGANAHIRAGTLFEEEASTAHAVGLKHTILMSFVTMGSLINFCDGLISGGSSRKKHTEVGSGFIHFNYTPHGLHGDKATPSLVGDVVEGVFLRQPRIFLGGLSGMVGPQKVGFGAFTVAGQVLRREVPANRIVGAVPRGIDKEFGLMSESPARVVGLNCNYIGNLHALRSWYGDVRLARIPQLAQHEHLRIVTRAAFDLLTLCIEERAHKLRDYLEERGLPVPRLSFKGPTCPLTIKPSDPYVDHVEWVAGLPEEHVRLGVSWLKSIVECFSSEC
jgi:UDP-N-acetylglucosamine/UDP-N-acetylgalactosamine diphosphorylase